jgi:hypothetical protein
MSLRPLRRALCAALRFQRGPSDLPALSLCFLFFGVCLLVTSSRRTNLAEVAPALPAPTLTASLSPSLSDEWPAPNVGTPIPAPKPAPNVGTPIPAPNVGTPIPAPKPEPASPSSSLPLQWGKPLDDLHLLIRRFGKPDKDESYTGPAPGYGAVTFRHLTYTAEHVVLIYSRKDFIGPSAPWELFNCIDSERPSLDIYPDEVLVRLARRGDHSDAQEARQKEVKPLPPVVSSQEPVVPVVVADPAPPRMTYYPRVSVIPATSRSTYPTRADGSPARPDIVLDLMAQQLMAQQLMAQQFMTNAHTSGGPVHVNGYYRKDGTYVPSYNRRR